MSDSTPPPLSFSARTWNSWARPPTSPPVTWVAVPAPLMGMSVQVSPLASEGQSAPSGRVAELPAGDRDVVRPLPCQHRTPVTRRLGGETLRLRRQRHGRHEDRRRLRAVALSVVRPQPHLVLGTVDEILEDGAEGLAGRRPDRVAESGSPLLAVFPPGDRLVAGVAPAQLGALVARHGDKPGRRRRSAAGCLRHGIRGRAGIGKFGLRIRVRADGADLELVFVPGGEARDLMLAERGA